MNYETIKKLLCYLFGHPNREHFHENENGVVTCQGGCEYNEDILNPIYDFLPCPRCGFWEEVNIKNKYEK